MTACCVHANKDRLYWRRLNGSTAVGRADSGCLCPLGSLLITIVHGRITGMWITGTVVLERRRRPCHRKRERRNGAVAHGVGRWPTQVLLSLSCPTVLQLATPKSPMRPHVQHFHTCRCLLFLVTLTFMLNVAESARPGPGILWRCERYRCTTANCTALPRAPGPSRSGSQCCTVRNLPSASATTHVLPWAQGSPRVPKAHMMIQDVTSGKLGQTCGN